MNVLFQAYMATYDRKWKEILKAIKTHDKTLKLEKKNGEEAKIWKLLSLSVDRVMVGDLEETLFITLIQYTAEDIKARVHAEGEDMVSQTYKWLCVKGSDLDEKELGILRSKVLNREGADAIKDVEQKVAKWKQDAMKMENMKPGVLKPDEDWIHPLWSIMPEEIQDHLIYRGLSPEKWKSYDEIEKAMEDFFSRWKLGND